jgi:N-acetylglucosamine kinase-like BadF-type ATPase
MSLSPISSLVMAVDGGQSSTLALAATITGQIVGTGWGGPSNHIHEPGGVERLQSALENSILSALQNTRHLAENVSHICLGMSGVTPLAGEIAQALVPSAQVLIHHDAVTALAGASIGQPGVIVIAGTGAVAYGQLDDGRSARTSGWGYIMGDEGSGYDIGCGALRAATQASDGRGRTTLLMERIPQHFGMDDLRAVHRGIYSHQITRPQIASLASVVGMASQDGDTVAQELLRTAGAHLATAALAVIERLNMLEAGMAVYTTGGVFRAGEAVLAPFQKTLQTRSRSSVVDAPAFSPIIGGLLLALKAAGIMLDKGVLQRIRDSAPEAAISKQAAPNL